MAFRRAEDGLVMLYREAAKADGEYNSCRPSTRNWRTKAETPATAGHAIDVPDMEVVAQDASPAEPDADVETRGSPEKNTAWMRIKGSVYVFQVTKRFEAYPDR